MQHSCIASYVPFRQVIKLLLTMQLYHAMVQNVLQRYIALSQPLLHQPISEAHATTFTLGYLYAHKVLSAGGTHNDVAQAYKEA